VNAIVLKIQKTSNIVGGDVMLDNGKISSRQYSALIALYVIGSAILNVPSMIAGIAKQDSWIAALLALVVVLLILPMYIQLGNRFSHENFTWYLEKVLGKWLGKIVALLFFVSFPFLIAVLSLRNLGDFMTIQIMPETPIQAIHIFFVIIVIMGVRLGLEPMARSAEIFFPVVIFLFLIFVLLISPQIHIENVQPILERGLQPVINGSLIFIGYPLLEPIILITLFPMVKSTDRNGRALFTGIIIAAIVLIAFTTLSILVLGPSVASNAYPSYALAKYISIAHFLERIEVIIAVIWFITLFVRLSLLVYITVLGIAQTLNLKEYRFLTLPISIILVIFSQVVFPNTAYFMEFTPIWTIHSLIMGFLFPCILWILGSFKK
jgi:spore germination protein KB